MFGQYVVRVRPAVRQAVPDWFWYAASHGNAHSSSPKPGNAPGRGRNMPTGSRSPASPDSASAEEDVVPTSAHALYDEQGNKYGSARFGTELEEHHEWVLHIQSHLEQLIATAVTKAKIHHKKRRKAGHHNTPHHRSNAKRMKHSAHARAGVQIQCQASATQLHLQLLAAAHLGHTPVSNPLIPRPQVMLPPTSYGQLLR